MRREPSAAARINACMLLQLTPPSSLPPPTRQQSLTHLHAAAVHAAQRLQRHPLLPQLVQLPRIAARLLQQALQLGAQQGCVNRGRLLLLLVILTTAAATRAWDNLQGQQCCRDLQAATKPRQ